MDLAAIRAPDSVAARRAEELCREVSPPWLVHHGLRTYLYGCVFAAFEERALDREAFWVASLLHDLGLTEAHEGGPDDVPCFAVRGALAAGEALAQCGWEGARRDLVAEAIVLHLNVRVPPERGPVAYCLAAATALDVAGIRIWDLRREEVEAVVGRHPRLGMKAALAAVWAAEARRRPGTRAAFLDRWLRFRGRIRSAPFAD